MFGEWIEGESVFMLERLRDGDWKREGKGYHLEGLFVW